MSKEMTPAQQTVTQGAELQARTIVTIYADEAEPFRFVANTDNNLTIDGNTYYAAEIKHGEIKTTTEGDKEQVPLNLSNRSQAWAAYMANNGTKLRGKRCKIEEVYLECPDDPPVWRFEGEVKGLKMTISEFACTVERDTVDYESESPNSTFDPICQYRKFKDSRCRYSGPETCCDRTLQRCIELGNVERFGGHPSSTRQSVIK